MSENMCKHNNFLSAEQNFKKCGVSCKVQLFWEGHKNLHNLPHGFEIYLVNFKTMRKIAQIFVAFSEKLNFNEMFPLSVHWCTIDTFQYLNFKFSECQGRFCMAKLFLLRMNFVYKYWLLLMTLFLISGTLIFENIFFLKCAPFWLASSIILVRDMNES